ncbi:MAG: hypothetical protein AAF126_23895, partial [Chloroflexota bacterium]
MTTVSTSPNYRLIVEEDPLNPLKYEFLALPTEHLNMTYHWQIEDAEGERLTQSQDNDNLIFVFPHTGEYIVRLIVKRLDSDIPITTIERVVDIKVKQPQPASSQNWTIAQVLVGLLFIGTTSGFVGLAWASRLMHDHIRVAEIELPLQLVGSVLLLLIAIVIAATIFRALGLADPSLAMALPEGSVRSIIALSLILIYVVSAIFLSQQIENIQFSKVEETQLSQTLAVLSEQSNIVSVSPDEDDNGFYIVRITSPLQEKTDFANQILTTLS